MSQMTSGSKIGISLDPADTDQMMVQRTLVVIKPDAVEMGVANQIIERYREAGLEVVGFDKINMEKETAQQLYAEHQGRHYFVGTWLGMISGPCIVLILEGKDAIRLVRELNGPSKDAPEGTIRGDFPSAGGPYNAVHGSDKPEAAAREIPIFFREMAETVTKAA